MDTAAPQIIYFTLDELEKDELPEALKEYINGILPQLKTVDGIMEETCRDKERNQRLI